MAWILLTFLLIIFTTVYVSFIFSLKKERSIQRSDVTAVAAAAGKPIYTSGQKRADIIIVGAGVAGSALAYSLAKDGRRVHAIERDLSGPNRISGEVLQPGGHLKLIELGLEDCLEDIDADNINGVVFYKDGRHTEIPYPAKPGDVPSKGFHNGRFVKSLRAKAASLPNVRLTEGTVVSLVEEDEVVKGVKYKTGDGKETVEFASLTIVCDGVFSNIRRSLCDSKVTLHSHFVGMLLKNCQLPYANSLLFILAKPGPIVIYPISSTDIRCIVDVPGQSIPSVADGEMATFFKNVISPQIPPELRDSFMQAAEEGDIKSMGCRSMSDSWRARRGVMMVGDSFNVRHPITGGGMTVALSDVVLIRDLLRALHNLDDETAVLRRLELFHVLRKPMASTINAAANIFYKVFCASEDEAREALREGSFEYLCLGGICAKGIVAHMLCLNPRPHSLLIHCCAIAVCAMARHILFPFSNYSLHRFWVSLRVLPVALSILVPIMKAEGLRQMFFPMTLRAYYNKGQSPQMKKGYQDIF